MLSVTCKHSVYHELMAWQMLEVAGPCKFQIINLEIQNFMGVLLLNRTLKFLGKPNCSIKTKGKERKYKVQKKIVDTAESTPKLH